MKTKLGVALICLVSLLICVIYNELKTPPPLPMTPNAEQQVKGNNKFAWELFRNLSSDKEALNKNIFVSPYSISTALGMTYAGAKNQTRTAISNTLHFPIEQGKTADAFKLLQSKMNYIKSNGDVKLGIANGLWINKGRSFLASFLETVRPAYDAELRTRDLIRQPEKVRKEINDWVEGKTNNCIKELLKKGTPLGDAVLVNAIYFKGAWAEKFDKADTDENARFYTVDNKELTIPMMKDIRDVPYIENEIVKAIELEYEGDDLSMIVILPKERNGVIALAENWTQENISKWMSEMYSQEVELSFPRFSMTDDYELAKKILPSMGMPKGGDFSGMIKNFSKDDTKVIHKAFIDVNEEGTEATAATAVIFVMSCAVEENNSFVAEHPFIFLIREKSTGSILFLGRVMNPTE